MTDPTKNYVPMSDAELAKWRVFEAIQPDIAERIQKIADRVRRARHLFGTYEDGLAVCHLADVLAGREQT